VSRRLSRAELEAGARAAWIAAATPSSERAVAVWDRMGSYDRESYFRAARACAMAWGMEVEE
jgi:hypothetical protein